MNVWTLEYTFDPLDYAIIRRFMDVKWKYRWQGRGQESIARVYNILTDSQKRTYEMFMRAADAMKEEAATSADKEGFDQ